MMADSITEARNKNGIKALYEIGAPGFFRGIA